MSDEAPLEVAPPDISSHRGAGPIPYLHRLPARDGAPGPHAVISAIVHGDEPCGAVVLDRLLRADFRPSRGALTLIFGNPEAYRRTGPGARLGVRAAVEDLNRLWGPEVLTAPVRSPEHARAKALAPEIATADALLDLHSMIGDGPAMILAGREAKGLALARRLGAPRDIVMDFGHADGVRMRDFGRFADPTDPATALLVECGPHYRARTVACAVETAARFLAALDMLPEDGAVLPRPPAPAAAQRVLEVTHRTTPETQAFRFVEDFQGGECIPRAGTVVAHDGTDAVATPYDGCVLIMPTPNAAPGRTAVRFAREVRT
ncbi:MAG: succinylglutamate desuccinylase/aspartoacylase family protein [Alphaproteobacteria bacterium]|nr:succinylglutamate desuccinylase/aspartoacylase family protein [Alphaproteobacteria bacterium]